jgi:hypothetical protein
MGMEAEGTMLDTVLNLLTQFVTIGGGLWMVWGAITLGIAIRNKTGPEIQSGVWQIIGGGLIVGAAQLFRAIL